MGNKSVYVSTSRGLYGSCHEDCTILEGDTKKWDHGHLNIEVYTDVDWAGNPNDKRSTSGYFTLVGCNLVTWRSKKQKVVALSSAEAEFQGTAKGITKCYGSKS